MSVSRYRASCRPDKIMTVPADADRDLVARQKDWLVRELQAHLVKLAALPFEEFRLFCDVAEVSDTQPAGSSWGVVQAGFQGETVSEYYDRYRRERGIL